MGDNRPPILGELVWEWKVQLHLKLLKIGHERPLASALWLNRYFPFSFSIGVCVYQHRRPEQQHVYGDENSVSGYGCAIPWSFRFQLPDFWDSNQNPFRYWQHKETREKTPAFGYERSMILVHKAM